MRACALGVPRIGSSLGAPAPLSSVAWRCRSTRNQSSKSSSCVGRYLFGQVQVWHPGLHQRYCSSRQLPPSCHECSQTWTRDGIEIFKSCISLASSFFESAERVNLHSESSRLPTETSSLQRSSTRVEREEFELCCQAAMLVLSSEHWLRARAVPESGQTRDNTASTSNLMPICTLQVPGRPIIDELASSDVPASNRAPRTNPNLHSRVELLETNLTRICTQPSEK